MHVHPVLPWNLKLQQPQLPRSEPDEQPNESSHLANVAVEVGGAGQCLLLLKSGQAAGQCRPDAGIGVFPEYQAQGSVGRFGARDHGAGHLDRITRLSMLAGRHISACQISGRVVIGGKLFLTSIPRKRSSSRRNIELWASRSSRQRLSPIASARLVESTMSVRRTSPGCGHGQERSK
jgi:hypothetical protein